MATILIVDDLAFNRKFLVTLLRSRGHRVIEAAGGADALVSVRSDRPDLVITDVLMPDMDGYELVRQLRLDPALSRMPVVFYTAHYGEREARALALSGRVSYVLTKPAESEQVLTVVARALAGQSETGIASADAPLAPAFDREHLRLVTDKVSEKTGDVRTANARLRAVINIGLELASERESERLLHRVCVAALDLFGATYVTLGILDRHDRTVQRFLSCGTEAAREADAACCFHAGDPISGILRTVVVERRALRGFNPGGDPSSLQLPPVHPQIQAYLAAPIASAAHVYGWICLVGNEGRAFTEDDEPLILALSGQVGRIYELEDEILERQHAESAVRQERDRAQRYLDTAEVIMLALDITGRITLVNRKACDLLGWTEEELVGRDWFDMCVPPGIQGAERQRFAAVLGGDLSIVERMALTRAGQERLIEWRNTLLRDDAGHVSGTFSSGSDVTERRTLEAQYQQAQKMEAVGQLAGGVAHDFNNVLTVILGYCELLLSDLDPDDPRHADISEIQQAGLSASGLTRQLLAFSRKQIIQPTQLDLNGVVTHVRAMLQRLIGVEVEIALRLAPELAFVRADRGQMEQVLMNLAVNARDAMRSGGVLTIETSNIELGEDHAKTHLGVIPGSYVTLTVADTGTGMTAAVQARLFEPFFTTKEQGQGTGLGLATVHGIITRSGGHITVASELGRGTSFRMYLPRADPATSTIEVRPVDRTGGAGETVLVVEDVDSLRDLAMRLLERQGYSVLAAANADEAFGLFESNARIDVLLTDAVMPGARGREMTDRLIALRPAMKVIYMSGYSAAAIVEHGVLNAGLTFLDKPFTSETLGRKVRQVLDRENHHQP